MPAELVRLGQKVDLSFMGLSLEVPEDWEIHQETQTRQLPDLATVFLANGYPDFTQRADEHTDAIHLIMGRCSDEADHTMDREQHLRGDRLDRMLERLDARVVRKLRPGTAAMPFEQGSGYEYTIEHHRDSVWTTRSYSYQFAWHDRCYSMEIINLDDRFQAARPTYEAIVRSITFDTPPVVEAEL